MGLKVRPRRQFDPRSRYYVALNQERILQRKLGLSYTVVLDVSELVSCLIGLGRDWIARGARYVLTLFSLPYTCG